MADLKDEFQVYLARKAEYLALYRGKVIVLKDGEVLGVYSDRADAIEVTTKTQPLGSFLVQWVTEDDDEVSFHSRHA